MCMANVLALFMKTTYNVEIIKKNKNTYVTHLTVTMKRNYSKYDFSHFIFFFFLLPKELY